jgi:hypothetical protein
VPTTRPRHTITETPPVQEALDRLRAQMGSQKLDVAELVMLGADVKLRRLQRDSDAAREERHRLAEMVRNRTLPEMDVAAADEVKDLGLIARYE